MTVQEKPEKKKYGFKEILSAFEDQSRFIHISNYEKQGKKIWCHMHFKGTVSRNLSTFKH